MSMNQQAAEWTRANLVPNENQDFVDSRKKSIWAENAFTDQIEGAEFEFWGLETKFERNWKNEFLKFNFEC